MKAVRVCPGEWKLTILELESCQLFFVFEDFRLSKLLTHFYIYFKLSINNKFINLMNLSNPAPKAGFFF